MASIDGSRMKNIARLEDQDLGYKNFMSFARPIVLFPSQENFMRANLGAPGVLGDAASLVLSLIGKILK